MIFNWFKKRALVNKGLSCGKAGDSPVKQIGVTGLNAVRPPAQAFYC